MHLVQNSQVLLGVPLPSPGENKYWLITISIISQLLKVAKYVVRLADKGIAIRLYCLLDSYSKSHFVCERVVSVVETNIKFITRSTYGKHLEIE